MKLFLVVALFVSTSLYANSYSHRIRDAIKPFIDDGEISGAVTLVAREGEVLSFESLGMADIEADRPMRRDDMFWVASMTKPFIGVAIMMLEEEGKLNVDDLVETHLPEFKDLWMIEEDSQVRRTLVRPAREITLFDLLTHTAGIGRVTEPRNHSTLGELLSRFRSNPFFLSRVIAGAIAHLASTFWAGLSKSLRVSGWKSLSKIVLRIRWA